MVIENFSALSQEELKQFAEKLLDKINTENIFSKETDFRFSDSDAIWADEMTGDLIIALDTVDDVYVAVKATWQAPEDDPGDCEDADEESPDFAEVFSKEVIIDGYKVTLSVDDYDFVERDDVQVDSYSHEDSGIGYYEFWGQTGYDSHPYLEVEGTFTNTYKVYVSLTVEPAETNK